MSDLPEPLVPADCDLRNFPFMPLDVRRLLSSETWIGAKDAAKLGHASMSLWCEAWHQVPAASLPDNDIMLARFAMCGLTQWKKLRPSIMRGWIKCSDGRFYHPVVAEKALESWAIKAHAVHDRNADRTRLKRWRDAKEDKRNADETRFKDVRNADETPDETPDETEMKRLREGQGQGQGQREDNHYAFSGSVIRLSDADLARWKTSFANLNGSLSGLLESRDSWLQTQSAADRKKWFTSTAAWLAKKNTEAQPSHVKTGPDMDL